jgi:hypothetical protein
MQMKYEIKSLPSTPRCCLSLWSRWSPAASSSWEFNFQLLPSPGSPLGGNPPMTVGRCLGMTCSKMTAIRAALRTLLLGAQVWVPSPGPSAPVPRALAQKLGPFQGQGQGQANSRSSFSTAECPALFSPPRVARRRHGNVPSLPILCSYWTAETQSFPEPVTAQVNMVLWGLGFLTIVLWTSWTNQPTNQPNNNRKTCQWLQMFSSPLLGQNVSEFHHSPREWKSKNSNPTNFLTQHWNHFEIWRLHFQFHYI